MGGWAGYILSRRAGCAAGPVDWLAACFPWGWLAGCAVRAAGLVVGLFGLWAEPSKSVWNSRGNSHIPYI